MLLFQAILISVLAVLFLYPTTVYAEDNSSKYLSETKTLFFYVNPHQDKEINLEEKVGKINATSYFDIIDPPKKGDIKWQDHIRGKIIYSTKFENTTDNIVITETADNQVKKINITFEAGIRPLITDHEDRIAVAGFLSTAIALFVTLIMRYGLIKSKSKFTDIIRGRDMDPSLSTFQFLVWTLVVVFAFIFIYCIKILAGDYNLAGSNIPYNLLVLMGISTVVPMVSTGISRTYYERDLTEENTVANAFDTKDVKELEILRKNNPLGKMLKEDNKPTLGRYQFFAWTFIGIFIYLFSLFGYVSANDQPQEIRSISIPDVDITFVALMGLSSTAYLGLKTVSNFMSIREVLPETVKPGDDLSIFGMNFGEESDTVWIGKKAIKSSEEPYKLIWSDQRIDFKVPQIEETGEGECDVRVVKKGSSVKYSKKISIQIPKTTNTTPAAGKDSTTTPAAGKDSTTTPAAGKDNN